MLLFIIKRPPFAAQKTAFDNILKSVCCAASCRLIERYGVMAVKALDGLVRNVQPTRPVAH